MRSAGLSRRRRPPGARTRQPTRKRACQRYRRALQNATAAMVKLSRKPRKPQAQWAGHPLARVRGATRFRHHANEYHSSASSPTAGDTHFTQLDGDWQPTSFPDLGQKKNGPRRIGRRHQDTLLAMVKCWSFGRRRPAKIATIPTDRFGFLPCRRLLDAAGVRRMGRCSESLGTTACQKPD